MNNILLNKLLFLSLFLALFMCIFVSYSYTNKRNIIFMRFINDIIKPLIRLTGIGSLVVLGLLLSLSADAQGWEKYYGDGADEEATAIIQTIDQGYAIAGRKFTNQGDFEFYVLRVDVDGTILWEYTFGSADLSPDFAYDIIETPDQGLVIVGETNMGGPFAGRDVFLLKIDKNGVFVTRNFFGTNQDDRGFGLQNTQDGGIILTGTSDNSIYVVKTDAVLEPLWETTIPNTVGGVGRDIIETPGGDFIIVGSIGDNSLSQVFVVRINDIGDELDRDTFGGLENDVAYDIIQASDGDYVIAGKKGNNSNFYVIKLHDNEVTLNLDLVWGKDYGLNSITEEARAIVETKDNGFVLAGFSDFGVDLQASLLKIDNDGEFIWQENYGRTGIDAANDLVQTATGGLVFAGFTSEPATFFPQDILLVKTDNEGKKVFTNHVIGNVFYDYNDNCSNDGGIETGIRTWTVKAVGVETYYGVTDEFGNYDIPVDIGSYVVSVVTPNLYWIPCLTGWNVNFPNQNTTLIRDFAIQQDTDIALCTDLEIDISTPFVAVCEESTFMVNYCNHGTTAAQGIEVGLVISNNFTYVSSGPPIAGFFDSLYTFEVGGLDIGECGSFPITVKASCDALLSETHYIKAHITPDAICPVYNGAEIAVNGYCDGDSVRFEISNVGGQAMSAGLDYIVVEDILIGLQEPNGPILASGQTIKFAEPANGSTYRLSAKQIAGHPGNSISPSIAVEGCVAGGGTDYTTGFYTQLPEDDKDHFLATDCQENVPITFGSQVKRGYPKGYGDSLKIASTTDLTYHIKFQNVGTDTAIRVVIRDTISPFLDPQTVRPGASSHDYEFEVYDNGILKFTFDNIMLIDSSTNEAASHGFVKYRITQKPDNPEGSLVKNSAAIFFDYYAPLTTDSVCNVIGGLEWTDFIIVSDHEIYIPKTDIKVYPNPVSQFATFELEGASIHPPLDFYIYDVAGRLVRSERFYDMTFTFDRGNLPAGMYFYQITTENQLVSTGKIITK